MSTLGAIGETGLNQVLAKRLTTPGASVAPGVAPELFPGLTLENDRPEWGYLKGERLIGTEGTLQAAVLGQRSAFRFVNPLRSNVLVVFEHIESYLGTLDNIVFAIAEDVTPLATELATASFDARFRDNPAVGVHAQVQVTVGSWLIPPINAVSLFRAIQVAAGVRYTLTKPIILRPGTLLEVAPSNDNVAIACSAIWRERRAQPGELV